jgi:chromate transport protein ChrA
MSGVLIYLGWWLNGVGGAVAAIPSFALCGFVAILVTLAEAKETEREV